MKALYLPKKSKSEPFIQIFCSPFAFILFEFLYMIYFSDSKMKKKININLFQSILSSVNVVQWSEDLYERQLIERTIDACGGPVDIVIDFGTTSRSLHRSMQCLHKGGVVLVSEEVGMKLLPKFSSLAARSEQKLRAVSNGTIEQLTELVKLVSSKQVRYYKIKCSNNYSNANCNAIE